MAPVPGDSPKTPVWHVDAARGPSTPSFDHLVGAGDECPRDLEAERLSCLKVDDQLDFRGLLDCQVGRLFALENPAGVHAGLAVRINNTAAVAHQAAGCGELSVLEDRGYRGAGRKCGEFLGSAIEEWIAADYERAGSQLGQRREGVIDIAFVARSQDMQLHPQCAGRRLHGSRLGLAPGVGRVKEYRHYS